MNHSFYNDNIMRYTSFIPEEYDILIDDEDVLVYDDSDEWYNIDGAGADV